MKLEVITWYFKNDTKFIYDYASVSILLDGKEVANWGDSYHDKGSEKAEGWVDCFTYLNPNCKVEHINKNNDEVCD